MTGAAFHDTRIFQQFLDRTDPELVAQLKKLNENLEALVEAVERAGDRGRGEADEGCVQ